LESSVISAVRRSHSTWSKGLIPSVLNTRSIGSDLEAAEPEPLRLRDPDTEPARDRVWLGAEGRPSVALIILAFVYRVELDEEGQSVARMVTQIKNTSIKL